MYEYAEVIFCPYSYIIDPSKASSYRKHPYSNRHLVVRKLMDIDVKDNIIILDEGISPLTGASH